MLGSEEGWQHGSRDLEGWGLTLELRGLTVSEASPAVLGGLLPMSSPCPAVPYKMRAGRGPQMGQPGAPSYQDPLCLGSESEFQADLFSIFPHLAALWALGELLLFLYPQTGRMELYPHVMSAAGAGGGGRAGTAPRGFATWLLPHSEGGITWVNVGPRGIQWPGR